MVVIPFESPQSTCRAVLPSRDVPVSCFPPPWPGLWRWLAEVSLALALERCKMYGPPSSCLCLRRRGGEGTLLVLVALTAAAAVAVAAAKNRPAESLPPRWAESAALEPSQTL